MFLLLLGQAFTQLSSGVLLWHDCIPDNKLVPSSVPLAINQSVSVQVRTFTRMWNLLDKKGLGFLEGRPWGNRLSAKTSLVSTVTTTNHTLAFAFSEEEN